MTIIVLIVSILSYLIKGFDYEEAILAAIIAGWLLSAYPHFHAHSDQPSFQQGLKTFLLALFFTLAYGVAGFYLLDRHFSVNFGFFEALQQTIIMFTEFYDPGLESITGFGRYFADSIYIVGAVTIGYSLIMMVRPVFIRCRPNESERVEAETIVKKYGRTVLARFALFNDKLYFFSSGGTVIAYVVKGRIALALGDPIGPEADFRNAIMEFVQYATRNDWRPVFYQTLPDNLKLYQAAGLNNICIGHEAIVDLTAFTLAGNAGKSLRTSVNRLTKLGFQAQIHEPPQPDHLIHQLRLISDEWLTTVKGIEKSFSLGWFEEDYIRDSQLITITAQDDTITAFANIIPEYQRNEVAVDLMRRSQQAEPGTMEYLFVSLFQWAKEKGYVTFNLGFSALAGIGKEAKDPLMEKGLSYIFEHLNQFYNFKGLHAFKTKFHPRWEPRYLIYQGLATGLPSIITALIKADSGDDFLWQYLKS